MLEIKYKTYTSCGTVLIESTKTIYVSDVGCRIVMFDIEDGSVKWNYETKGEVEAVTSFDNESNF